MINQKEIVKQIYELSGLGDMARVYAEISSVRMKHSREGVLKSRHFLQNIDDVFQEVRRSYRREVVKLSKKRKTIGGNKITFLAHNGKTVVVLLSANTGLYGRVVRETFHVFSEEVDKGESEVTVVGRLGRSMFLSKYPNTPYTYFDFPDVGTDKEKFLSIIQHIVQYEEIHIHYGKFHSIISQRPEMYNITAETPIDQETAGSKSDKGNKYIFEPALEKVLAFFEAEMFASMMDQTMQESQLAKFASRMLAMDQAYENIKGRLKKMKLMKLKIMHDVLNRKQMDSLASIHLWRTR